MSKTWPYRIVDMLLIAAVTAGLAAAVLSGFTAEERTGALPVLVAGVALFLVIVMTRARWSCAVLFLLGCILCAGAYFLRFPIPLWAFLLFAFAAAAEYLWRMWYVLARQADVGAVRFGAGAAGILVFCLAAFAVGGGIYLAVVRPLSPPTRELKLITELKRMDVLKVLGVSRLDIVLDPELESGAPPEEEEQGNESGEEESDALDDLSAETPPPPSATGDSASGTEEADTVRYDFGDPNLLWLLLLIPLALALAFALRAHSRRRWRARVKALPGRDAVVNYYRYFLSRLGRAGYPRPGTQTPREYAARNGPALEPFARCEGGFPRLTAIYEKALYGRGEIDETERALFEETCDAFPAALKRELGPVKYYLGLLRN